MDPERIATEYNRRTVSLHYNLNNSCSICLNNLYSRKTMNLPCGHSYHMKCFKLLQNSKLESKNACPLCRQCYDPEQQEIDDLLKTIADILLDMNRSSSSIRSSPTLFIDLENIVDENIDTL